MFFAFGALMASLAAVGLVFPDGALEPMWRLNRHAQVGLMELRGWGIALMLGVASACAVAAIGIWRRAWWGHRLALTILAVNLLGDVMAAIVQRDPRTLIGIPIGGAIIYYLLSSRTRAQFDHQF
ncbi:MAG TPA: hypothetical protein VH439_02750 [Gemmatimonadales bacterium]